MKEDCRSQGAIDRQRSRMRGQVRVRGEMRRAGNRANYLHCQGLATIGEFSA
jgi:hypothetical protein